MDMKSSKTPKSKGKPLSQDKAASILKLLDLYYLNARCTLEYRTPLELLVATILSAQCTDERVNRVTPELFKKYPDADAYARVPLEELEADIKSTGFYHNKARSIQACCRDISQNYSGKVPAQLEALVKLPGIGRKTANVILGNAFQVPGIAVDTHVGRVAHRLGLTFQKDPVKIEQDLMTLIPQAQWVHFSHQLIMHGRAICQARKPNCAICPLQSHCDFFLTDSRGANSSGGRA
jgi:endonuclease III